MPDSRFRPARRPGRRQLCAFAGALTLLVLGALLSAAWSSTAAAGARASFYDWLPAQAQGARGSMIRAEPMGGAPEGSRAWRILYRSTGLAGEPIAVSGVIVVPDGPAPAGGRPVVAWAHPTSGIVPRCAPSLALGVFRGIEGLPHMLARGWVVVATDYPGLGTRGPHPYLVGRSEGAAVLDSVRAARDFRPAQAGRLYQVWGHSQGGQAALFAGLMAAGQAPDLQLRGIAAAAPATDLETLLRADFRTVGGRNLTAMTLWSWTRTFGLPLDGLVDPLAMPAVDALAHECIESAFDMALRMVSQRGLQKHFLTVPDITRVEPWRSLLLENSPGPLPPGVPLLLTQGSADTLVLLSVTRMYAARQCAAGGRVRLLVLPDAGHGFIARDSAEAAVEWMAARFAGSPAPDDCAALSDPGPAADVSTGGTDWDEQTRTGTPGPTSQPPAY
ncbi:lipase family protein [Variovorax sp. OV329]|uniref:lipase family protein n=1 Tax=Variovorax sp. OV329 TaxID=1882825 RepID=UPI0008EBA884|nr:lipase family protein [Variovorax sp. OV329]SFM93052.1 Secretory lipase [Variovorax sp. OV329]